MHDGLDDAVHVVVQEVRASRAKSRDESVSQLIQTFTIENFDVNRLIFFYLTNLVEKVDDFLLGLIRCYPVV